MFKVKQLVWVMGCVSVMSGCAWYQITDKQTVRIKPVMDVKHAAGGPGAMYSLGRYYQGKANYKEAIAAFEKALAMNPDHVQAHNGLGVSYFLQGRHELAMQHLRKAVELSPMATHLHNNLGYALLAQGQESEAAAAFVQALRLDPENRKARSNLAAVYEKLGLHDKAAMLTASPGPIAAPPAISAMAPTPTLGAPSVFMPANVTAAAVEKQGVPRSTDTRLVEVAPNIFEFRLTEAVSMMSILASKTADKAISPQESHNLDSKNVRIEVSNGNGATDMAKQVSSFLQQNGFAKPRLTDRPPFQQAQTEIHYRRGYDAIAAQISEMMPNRAPMVESYNLRKDIQIRVMLGKDITRDVAHFDARGMIQVARGPGNAIAGDQVGE